MSSTPLNGRYASSRLPILGVRFSCDRPRTQERPSPLLPDRCSRSVSPSFAPRSVHVLALVRVGHNSKPSRRCIYRNRGWNALRQEVERPGRASRIDSGHRPNRVMPTSARQDSISGIDLAQPPRAQKVNQNCSRPVITSSGVGVAIHQLSLNETRTCEVSHDPKQPRTS